MADSLLIFASVGPDLEVEREVIGKVIARLPVSLGWVIKYTPVRGERVASALDAVAASHFYVLLLGGDIRAPVGSELYVARQTGKRVLAFLKNVARTPAARVFVKDASLDWERFRAADELGPLLQRALIGQILEGAQTYSLSPVDWETLTALLAELADQEEPERQHEEVAPGYRGAGEDAVIVAPGRDLPGHGVLIENQDGPA